MKEQEEFEEQAPQPFPSRLRQASPLAANSVRTNLPPCEHWYGNGSDSKVPPSPETVHSIWLKTNKIATRFPEGAFQERRSEDRIILAAYDHALSLGDSPETSAYRDTLVDAMAEFTNDYGFMWRLGDRHATLYQALYPMWKVCGFYFALSNHPFFYPHIGPLHREPERNEAVNHLLDSCFRQQLEIVKKGRRPFKEIWESYLSSNRCMLHEHKEARCKRAGSQGDGQVRALL